MAEKLPSLNRIFNVAVAGTLLVATSPLLALGATLSAIDHGENPFMTQTRVGYKQKLFEVFKLKTMHDLYDEDGALLPGNERTSFIGKILRKSKIDELPQLFNVLMGDMDIVGPRPLLASMDNSKRRALDEVKPGLTCLFELLTPTDRIEANRIAADDAYTASKNIVGDIEIMLSTPLAIIQNLTALHYNPNGEFLNTSLMATTQPNMPQ